MLRGSVLEWICVPESCLDHLVGAPCDGGRKWLNGDSHSQTWKKADHSFFLENGCCCIHDVFVFYLIVCCYEQHLSWLGNQRGTFGWFDEFLCALGHFLTDWSFLAWAIETSLCIKSCLDDIKRRGGYWGQSTCDSTAQIIIKMVIAFFNLEQFL